MTREDFLNRCQVILLKKDSDERKYLDFEAIFDEINNDIFSSNVASQFWLNKLIHVIQQIRDLLGYRASAEDAVKSWQEELDTMPKKEQSRLNQIAEEMLARAPSASRKYNKEFADKLCKELAEAEKNEN